MGKQKNWLAGVTVAVLIILMLIAVMTKAWLITAAIIGFMFGFAMQKGSFCGASIISSVILYRDLKGVKAFIAVIAVSMIGFAGLAALGWIKLNPKGLELLPMALGGLIFGIGMVLGGGCISGSLYKAGEGRLTSILALLGIGLGTNMVQAGALREFAARIAATTANIRISNSLDQMIDVDYKIWAIIIFIFVAVILFMGRRRLDDGSNQNGLVYRVISKKWSIITSGAVIGVIAWFAYLSSAAAGRNYTLGVTGGVMAVAAFLAGVNTKFNWWLLIEVLAVMAGSAVSAKLSGDLKFRSADPQTLIIAFSGGIIMGIGAVMADGCFIGNMTSGWALLSSGSLVAGISTIFGNWIATYYYLRGK